MYDNHHGGEEDVDVVKKRNQGDLTLSRLQESVLRHFFENLKAVTLAVLVDLLPLTHDFWNYCKFKVCKKKLQENICQKVHKVRMV